MTIGGVYIPLTWIVAGLVAASVALVAFGRRRSHRQLAIAVSALRDDVLARGWQHEATEHGATKTHRFRGTTGGISWTVTSVFVREAGERVAWRAWTNWSAPLPEFAGMLQWWPTQGRTFPTGTVFRPPAAALSPLAPQLSSDDQSDPVRIESLLEATPVAVPAELANRFHVLASGAVDGTRAANVSARAVLEYLGWAGSSDGLKRTGTQVALILARASKLTVLTRGATTDPLVIERLTELGMGLVHALGEQRR